jgi:hypothetical protein
MRTDTLTATYAGDTGHTGSSGTGSVTVMLGNGNHGQGH